MKNISRTLLALAGFALMVQGCEDKADTTTILVNNGNPAGQPKVTYVLQVVDAAGNVDGRTAGVAAATIRYRTAAGTSKSVATDAGGNVVITDVNPGSFSARLESQGYASMDFTTDINPGVNVLGDSGKEYVASTRLYAIRSNATIAGRVYGNYTGASQTFVNPESSINRNEVNLKVTYSIVKTGANAYPMGSGTGRITDISLDPNTVSFNTEPTGDFSVGDLHATSSGYIQANLSMMPYLPANAPASFITSFVLVSGNNSIPVNLGSGETLRLGNLLAARP